MGSWPWPQCSVPVPTLLGHLSVQPDVASLVCIFYDVRMIHTVLKVMLVRSLGIFESSPVLSRWSKRLFSSSTTLCGVELGLLSLDAHWDVPRIFCTGGLLNRGGTQLLDVI